MNRRKKGKHKPPRTAVQSSTQREQGRKDGMHGWGRSQAFMGGKLGGGGKGRGRGRSEKKEGKGGKEEGDEFEPTGSGVHAAIRRGVGIRLTYFVLWSNSWLVG